MRREKVDGSAGGPRSEAWPWASDRRAFACETSIEPSRSHNGPRDAGDVAYADPRNRRRDRGPQVASRLATARAELVSAPRTISRLPAGDELDHLAFAVPDVDRFLREHRGDLRVVMKAFYEGTDRLAYVMDPDGAWIELMSRRKSSKRPARGSP